MNSDFIKNKLKDYVNSGHNFFFGNNAGERTMSFVKNTSLSFSGGIVAFSVLFIANIIAARVLGPLEYGKYAVVFSIAQIFSLFFVLELDISALYFLSDNSEKKKSITSSINVMFLINIVIFIFLGIGMYQFISPPGISQFAFVSAIVMGLTFAFKRMVDAFLRIENKFKKQAISKMIESIVVVGLLVALFWIIGKQGYYSYALSIIFGGAVFIIFGGVLVRNMFVIRGATAKCINTVFHYNIFGVVGAIVNNIIKNVDKIIVVAFLGASVGGLYTVYFTASVIVGARMTQLFINVFFPAVRKKGANTQSVFKKVNILFYKTFIPLIVVASGGVLVIIILYGSQYPVRWYWVVLSGVYIAVHFFASVYGWLLSSISRDGYKKYNLSFVYGSIIYGAFLLIVFINDLFGITALLTALIIYRVVGGIVSFMELKSKLKN